LLEAHEQAFAYFGVVLLIGEAGVGKSHLATGLCVAACRQQRRVRFTAATR